MTDERPDHSESLGQPAVTHADSADRPAQPDLPDEPSSDGGPTPAPLPVIHRLGEGSPFGDFELLREIGRGGMGIVYLAMESTLKRKLAVKILPHSVAADPKMVERFLREARAAARLRHPNIIPIYSAGEIDGIHYYSMEYVPGISLAKMLGALREFKLYQKGWLSVRRFQEDDGHVLRIITEGSSPGSVTEPDEGERILSFALRNYVHEALGLFAGVADALHFAHSEGVIHRDIKPSNLLLAPDGNLLVADFGLAKVGGARSITKTGDLVGSPSYMSPEQTMSRRSKVDHRTDIWSFGVTLYEFLTLRHPFEAKNLEVSIHNILDADPTPLREVNPRLPKDVETIVMMCLEKNPDRRYQSAADLASDLRAVLSYESIQARSASPIQVGLRYVRRHMARLAIGVLLVMLIAVASFAAYLQRERGFSDVELAIAYFNGSLGSQEHVDSKLVAEVQRKLRAYRRDTTELRTALDMYAMDTQREAEAHLPTAASAGDLDVVLAELKKLSLIHHHTADAEVRERRERVDRATADLRVRLVWALADTLAERSPGIPGVPDRDVFDWLVHFLGQSGMRDGVPPERNLFVRRNAVLAIGGLTADPRFGAEAIDRLSQLLLSSGIGGAVHGEAIQMLAQTPAARRDPAVVQRVANLLAQERHLPELGRLRAVEFLASSSYSAEYREIFEKLAADPVKAIANAARLGLAAD